MFLKNPWLLFAWIYISRVCDPGSLNLMFSEVTKVYARGGGYSTLVWVGVCRWDFWNATHPCTYFEGKVTHPCTKNQNFSLKFAPFWRKFRKILKSWPIKVPNLRHFGANFRKFWKIDPSKYHVFEKKGPIDVPGGLILLPMFAAHPYNHFCTEYPPRGFMFHVFKNSKNIKMFSLS